MSVLRTILLPFFMIFASCSVVDEIKFTELGYVDFQELPTGIVAYKSSDSRFKETIKLKEVHKLIESAPTDNNSFTYITHHARLLTIKDVAGVKVNTSHLQPSQRNRLFVYHIQGNPNMILKATITENNNEY